MLRCSRIASGFALFSFLVMSGLPCCTVCKQKAAYVRCAATCTAECELASQGGQLFQDAVSKKGKKDKDRDSKALQRCVQACASNCLPKC
jgi:hypothetical protein